LVAPIALYPDSLVAQILAASTFPEQVVEADRWVQSRPDLKGDALAQAVDQQPWDPSVKALTAFPSVLGNMDHVPVRLPARSDESRVRGAGDEGGHVAEWEVWSGGATSDDAVARGPSNKAPTEPDQSSRVRRASVRDYAPATITRSVYRYFLLK
jgi:hypothetical protein